MTQSFINLKKINSKKKKRVFRITKIKSRMKKLRKEPEKDVLQDDSIVLEISDMGESGNLNNFKDDDSRTNPNSLISISKEVYKFLGSKVRAKGTTVTDHILNNVLSSEDSSHRFKNIQRRVYDAINVMSAIGILEKNKSNLIFKGKLDIKRSKTNTVKNKENQVRCLTEQLHSKFNDINKKQHELAGLCSKVFFKVI
jgi:hypothetical protein